MTELPERFRHILDTLVGAYIEHGEPVSSLWLARRGGLRVSSATVRNVLVRLEELGYLRQPHTSAGRVPTDRGYRCYVNGLLEDRRPPRPAAEVEARLRGAETVDEVLSDVSWRLSRTLHHLSFAVAPETHTMFIRGMPTLVDVAASADATDARATLRALLRMVEEKHRLARLLTEYIEAPGVIVVIGTEHTAPDLRHFSLVAAPYSDGRRTGTVGVIGPTRMRYSRAISAVDSVSQAVSRVLRMTMTNESRAERLGVWGPRERSAPGGVQGPPPSKQ